MPVYEYQCPSCKWISEVMQKDDDPSPICGDCEVLGNLCEMNRLISKGGTFILKGSCWARDGYSGVKKEKEQWHIKLTTSLSI